MSLHASTCLLGLLAVLPSAGSSCQSLLRQEERGVNTYGIAVRVRTRDGTPIPGVLVSNPDSGTRGISDAQGQIPFRIDGLEGMAVSFRVEHTPEGIVEVDDSLAYRVILKSIVGKNQTTGQGSDLLTYDILMRRNREMYVVLVSTKGIGDLPVSANGVALGKLNALGAGAFRLKGQPGEELKVIIQTGQSPLALTQDNPEQTFPLPATSSILSFASTLALVPESQNSSAAKPIITFVPKASRHSHRRLPPGAAPKPEPAAGPVQVPFRDVPVR